jgi:thioredoxin-dependent peroxiredoxin
MKRLALALALLLAAAVAAAQTTDKYPVPQAPPATKGQAATSMPSSSRLTVGLVEKGDRAPDFELQLAGGGKVKLSSLRGQWVVVSFCPKRSLELVDSLARSVPERVPVIGVVPEKVGTLSAWVAQHPTKALLLEDMRCDIAALYGAWDVKRSEPRSGYVIVDPKGVVNRIEITANLSPEEAARAVQYAVTGL